MKRDQRQHVIRAAARVTGGRELIVIGSQAILGEHPDAPEGLLRSDEADLYVPRRPEILDCSWRRSFAYPSILLRFAALTRLAPVRDTRMGGHEAARLPVGATLQAHVPVH